MTPSQFFNLDRQERAFIIAAIDVRVEREKKKQKEEKKEINLIIINYDLPGKIEIEDLEEWSEYIEASNLFSELFSYKANLLGENFVLKAVYQYLKIPAPECNQIEFLYRLGE